MTVAPEPMIDVNAVRICTGCESHGVHNYDMITVVLANVDGRWGATISYWTPDDQGNPVQHRQVGPELASYFPDVTWNANEAVLKLAEELRWWAWDRIKD